MDNPPCYSPRGSPYGAAEDLGGTAHWKDFTEHPVEIAGRYTDRTVPRRVHDNLNVLE
jgi:hypothetical protein